MKVATSMTLAATIGAALALAQTRQMAMVKNSPTNYGTNGFDISLVDNSTQKYYLADRTNDAIDLVNAATDTLLGFIGKNQYTGARPCPGSPRDLRNCAGPNGVVTDNSGHVWPAIGKQSGEIVVDAHPESFQLEKNGTRVSVNVRDRKEIQVADVVKGTNLARWPTTVAEDPDRYDRIARYPMPAGTRTSLFVPEWGRLFAAVPHRGIQGSGILVYEAN